MWDSAGGTAIHTWLDQGADGDELFLEMPMHVDGEEIPLRGKLDHYNHETRHLIDYKSVAKWNERWLPKDDHLAQVQLYALLLRFHGHAVERAHIWYVRKIPTETKDEHGNKTKVIKRKVVPVDLWDPIEAEIYAYHQAQSLARAKQTGKLPPAIDPESRDAWRCDYCPVAEICRDRERRERAGDDGDTFDPDRVP